MKSKPIILMLIDDDSDDRFLFKTAVESVNPEYSCILSEGGKEAFHQLSEQEKLPDLIFLDVNMPGMSGWDFLKKIKQEDALKNIPILMYSTSAHESDVSMAHELNAAGYCVKPEDFNGLQTIIHAIVEGIESGDVASFISTNDSLKYLRHTKPVIS